MAGVAQWIEHKPANQKAVGSTSSQGTCLGCRLDPQLRVCERQLICLSPTLSLSLPLSLKINK